MFLDNHFSFSHYFSYACTKVDLCVVQVAFNVFIQAANSNLLPMKLETFQHRAKQNVRKGMKVVVTRSSTYLYQIFFTHHNENKNKARREPSIKGRIAFKLDFNLVFRHSRFSRFSYNFNFCECSEEYLLVVVDIRKM